MMADSKPESKSKSKKKEKKEKKKKKRSCAAARIRFSSDDSELSEVQEDDTFSAFQRTVMILIPDDG